MNPEPNTLASLFNKWRETIEAAETPFAKLAIFILPIIAPIVPASLTGLHLFKLFLTIFTFTHADYLSGALSGTIALVLELLGYVGAISFIQAVFHLVQTHNSLYALPAVLNGCAYLFYLILMFMVNYLLGQYFNTPNIINNIVGLLSFVTVPTGLLAANYLSQKEIKEDEKEIRAEKRNERIEKARIRASRTITNEQTVTNVRNPRTNTSTNERQRTNGGELRTFVWTLLDDYERTNRTVAGVSELAKVIARTANEQKGVPDSVEGYERYKGYVSEVRKMWLNNHPQYMQ